MLKSHVVRKIIQIGNPILNQKSASIPQAEIVSRENMQLYQDLIDTCEAEKEGTAGLSAVQIGELKRAYVVRRLDLDREDDANPIWEVMINPTVKILGNSKSIIWEGCMSVGTGKNRLFGPVARPDHVAVSFTNIQGEQQTHEFVGYMAHIVQHEQDHLDGILFLKYVTNPANLWPNSKLDKYLDKHNDFPTPL
jgi:peptide deformylase